MTEQKTVENNEVQELKETVQGLTEGMAAMFQGLQQQTIQQPTPQHQTQQTAINPHATNPQGWQQQKPSAVSFGNLHFKLKIPFDGKIIYAEMDKEGIESIDDLYAFIEPLVSAGILHAYYPSNDNGRGSNNNGRGSNNNYNNRR